MSLQDQFDSAKAYIQRKEYDDARRILKKIDHPKAKDWLARIDKASPPKPIHKKWWFRTIAFFVVIGFALAILYVTVIQPQLNRIFINVSAQIICDAGEAICEDWADTFVENYDFIVRDCFYDGETVASMYYDYYYTFKTCMIENGYATDVIFQE